MNTTATTRTGQTEADRTLCDAMAKWGKPESFACAICKIEATTPTGIRTDRMPPGFVMCACTDCGAQWHASRTFRANHDGALTAQSRRSFKRRVCDLLGIEPATFDAHPDAKALEVALKLPPGSVNAAMRKAMGGGQ